MGGEFIGPHRKRDKKDPISFGPRLITDKEEQEIIESVTIQEQEEDDQPPKKPITELLTETTTTTRPKVRDILTGSGVT